MYSYARGGVIRLPHYPPPNNPQVVKAALIFARDTRELVNTMHFSRLAGWDVARMTQLARDLVTWWNSLYSQAVPNNIALTQVQVRLYDPANPLAVDLPVSPPTVGRRTGASEAGNVSLTMSERTGLAGRAHRGRIYIPAVGEVDVPSSDIASSALVTLLGTAIANLIFGFTTSEGVLGIFHRPQLLPHPLDNKIDNVTSYVIEDIIDSQRRRLPGRGR